MPFVRRLMSKSGARGQKNDSLIQWAFFGQKQFATSSHFSISRRIVNKFWPQLHLGLLIRVVPLTRACPTQKHGTNRLVLCRGEREWGQSDGRKEGCFLFALSAATHHAAVGKKPCVFEIRLSALECFIHKQHLLNKTASHIANKLEQQLYIGTRGIANLAQTRCKRNIQTQCVSHLCSCGCCTHVIILNTLHLKIARRLLCAKKLFIYTPLHKCSRQSDYFLFRGQNFLANVCGFQRWWEIRGIAQNRPN